MANAWSIATRAAGWLGLSAALAACGNSTTGPMGAAGGGGQGPGAGGSDGSGGSGQGAAPGTGGGGGEGPDSPLEFEGPLPEFSLDDVNGTSATNGQAVNPRDYLGQVSAWYFAHAT